MRANSVTRELEPILKRASAKHDQGSATVEFLILGLPLLVASLLFFVTIHQNGLSQSQGRALAREALHTFVNSANDLDGYLRVGQLIDRYESEKKISLEVKDSEFPDGKLAAGRPMISFTIQCQRYPCISPSNQVSIEIFSNSTDGKRIEIARARSSVSRWIP